MKTRNTQTKQNANLESFQIHKLANETSLYAVYYNKKKISIQWPRIHTAT